MSSQFFLGWHIVPMSAYTEKCFALHALNVSLFQHKQQLFIKTDNEAFMYHVCWDRDMSKSCRRGIPRTMPDGYKMFTCVSHRSDNLIGCMYRPILKASFQDKLVLNPTKRYLKSTYFGKDCIIQEK